MKPLTKLLVSGALFIGGEIVGVLTIDWWLQSIGVAKLPTERITTASNAIIQLDSFIIAGFIIGFFYLWERLAKQKAANPNALVIGLSFTTIIAMALSGILAVGAILTLDSWYLQRALNLLVYGVLSILFNWYVLQLMISEAKKTLAS